MIIDPIGHLDQLGQRLFGSPDRKRDHRNAVIRGQLTRQVRDSFRAPLPFQRGGYVVLRVLLVFVLTAHGERTAIIIGVELLGPFVSSSG